jgi:hypothetical protein
MKVYDVVFDEKQDKGVYALSCVENPAMEDAWLALADHPREIQFSAVNEEKKLLLGAALIPNKKIYRNIDGEEFYIKFSEETIEKAAHNFVKNGYVNNSSENHDIKLDGVSVVQSWIVENPEKDKSANYGKTYEKGTWVTMMKVDNEETWQKAKNGQLNGFSIDGLFSLKEVQLNKIEMTDKKGIIDAIKEGFASMLKKEEIKMGQLKLKDGKTKIEFEGDKPELDMPVFLVLEDGEKARVPEGEHELESGEILFVDKNGLVAEAPKEEDEVEEPKEDELVAALQKMFDAFKVEFSGQLKEVEDKFSLKLKEQEDLNKVLEAKLEKEPAAPKIVKVELDKEVLDTKKGRLFNALLNAQN